MRRLLKLKVKYKKETRIYKQITNGIIQAAVYYQGNQNPVLIYIHGGALITGCRTNLADEQLEFFLIYQKVYNLGVVLFEILG
jgi:acetyl esterase/lipase